MLLSQAANPASSMRLSVTARLNDWALAAGSLGSCGYCARFERFSPGRQVVPGAGVGAACAAGSAAGGPAAWPGRDSSAKRPVSPSRGSSPTISTARARRPPRLMLSVLAMPPGASRRPAPNILVTDELQFRGSTPVAARAGRFAGAAVWAPAGLKYSRQHDAGGASAMTLAGRVALVTGSGSGLGE